MGKSGGVMRGSEMSVPLDQRRDSSAKYLFAGLGLLIGVVLILLFLQPFLIWVRFHDPKAVTIEDVARARVPDGGQVRVEGIVDPRYSHIVKAPGGEGLIEVGLILANDMPMGQWQDALTRDSGAFREALDPALNGELKHRNIKDYFDAVDVFASKFEKHGAQLGSTVKDAWPNYAVGFARPYAGTEEPGFRNRIHLERGWVLQERLPAGGLQQRPPWPEDIVLSNPIKPSEMPKLRAHLDEEVAYWEGTVPQVVAELEASAVDQAFGEVVTVVGTVRPLPTDAYESFEAVDDLLFDIFFYVMEGEEPATIGLIFVPLGLGLVLLMAVLMLIWALAGRSRYDRILTEE